MAIALDYIIPTPPTCNTHGSHTNPLSSMKTTIGMCNCNPWWPWIRLQL